MQLAVPHKGWENEHLATFLLSRIAFVASPVKVGDDVGTDVFCTLFEVTKHKERDVLLPRSSIAVQIKSNRDPVDVASKLDYLHRLEVLTILASLISNNSHWSCSLRDFFRYFSPGSRIPNDCSSFQWMSFSESIVRPITMRTACTSCSVTKLQR